MKRTKKFLVFLAVASAIIIMMVVLARIAIAPGGFEIERAMASVPKHELVEFITPELRAICGAESTGDPMEWPRHWNADGTVLRGRVDPDDTGQCQINKRYWGEKAVELGHDIEDFNGNRRMANWIYENYGSGPWSASESMWNR